MQAIRSTGKTACFRLRKTLYGLKQGPHNWMTDVFDKFRTYGLIQCRKASCVWSMREQIDGVERIKLLVCCFADDIGIASVDATAREDFISFLHEQYDIGVVRPMESYIGYKVERDAATGTIRISQPAHILAMADRFHLDSASKDVRRFQSPMAGGVESLVDSCHDPGSPEAVQMQAFPYDQLIGCLTYLSGSCRPDIAVAVRLLSQVTKNPAMRHWKMAKRVLRYLVSTANLGLSYEGGCDLVLFSHTDASWAGNRAHRKYDRHSPCGYFTMLANGPIHWSVVLQKETALSTCESEYYGLYHGILDVRAFRDILNYLGLHQTAPTIVYCDNEASAIWSEGQGKEEQKKHIDPEYSYVEDQVERKQVVVHHLSTHLMPADALTKVLSERKFLECRERYMTTALTSAALLTSNKRACQQGAVSGAASDSPGSPELCSASQPSC